MKNLYKNPTVEERAQLVAWFGEAWVVWLATLPPPGRDGLLTLPPLPKGAPVPSCFVEGAESFARYLEAGRYAKAEPYCRDCNARDQARMAARGLCDMAGRVRFDAIDKNSPIEGWLDDEALTEKLEKRADKAAEKAAKALAKAQGKTPLGGKEPWVPLVKAELCAA